MELKSFFTFYNHQDTDSLWWDMETGSAGPISTHKNIEGSLGKWHKYPSILEGNIVAYLHVYVGISIFILLCDNQGTEYGSWEIQIGVAGPIFTNQNIKGSVRQWYIYSIRRIENIVTIIHIYRARAIFLLF